MEMKKLRGYIDAMLMTEDEFNAWMGGKVLFNLDYLNDPHHDTTRPLMVGPFSAIVVEGRLDDVARQDIYDPQIYRMTETKGHRVWGIDMIRKSNYVRFQVIALYSTVGF